MKKPQPPDDDQELTRTVKPSPGSGDPDATVYAPVERLGDFEILGELGRGGMGVVYKARQISLDRRVALKVLPPAIGLSPQAKTRFEREARAAAKLQHNNIVPVHAIGEQDGQHFYAMDLIEGMPLDGILSDVRDGNSNDFLTTTLGIRDPSQQKDPETGKPDFSIEPQTLPGRGSWFDISASIVADVADALDYAHGEGVIHRDIKPANILISDRGQPCVTDFGLADVVHEPGLTATGALLGTPAYMSPEQVAAGRMKIDQRTDIYSLGAVLYEALTLQRAVQGNTREEIISQILTKEPAPPRQTNRRIPLDLQTICLKALEKDPDRRYQSAGEMAKDLREYLGRGLIAARPIGPVRRLSRLARRHPTGTTVAAVAASLAIVAVLAVTGVIRLPGLSPAGSSEVKRLAVFPFRNVSGDPEEEFYAVGLTDVLTTDLGKIRSLQVVPRTAVMQFQNQDMPLREIAAALRADIIVEGSVLRSGGQVRVTAALIDPATDSQLWSDNYERPEEDILVLQGEVARAIANEIRIELTPQEEASLASARPVDPQAQEAYLKGRYSLLRMTEQGVLKSIEYFEESIAHDPDYAMAHAGLADGYYMLGVVGFTLMPAKEAMLKAKAAALKALELDEMLAEAHVALGSIHTELEWDFERAEQEFLRAIELNPSLGTARAQYAYLLGLLGRHDEAIAQVHIGTELDPLNLWLQLIEGASYLFASRYDEAYDRYAGVLELDPNNATAYWAHGIIDIQRGNLDEAIASLKHARDLAGPLPGVLGTLGQAYGLAGRRAEAEGILTEMTQLSATRHVPADAFAYVHIGLGDLDAAFDALEQGYLDRSGSLLTSLTLCFTKPLHGDPRCAELRRRAGLSPAAPAVD